MHLFSLDFGGSKLDPCCSVDEATTEQNVLKHTKSVCVKFEAHLLQSSSAGRPRKDVSQRTSCSPKKQGKQSHYVDFRPIVKSGLFPDLVLLVVYNLVGLCAQLPRECAEKIV